MLKAIETIYKGYRFRSRLEARQAVFFDAMGIPWEYEPEGFETVAGRYLPDFKIRVLIDAPGASDDSASDVYVEMKAGPGSTEADWVKAKALARWDGTTGEAYRNAKNVLLLAGPPGFSHCGGRRSDTLMLNGQTYHDVVSWGAWTGKERAGHDGAADHFAFASFGPARSLMLAPREPLHCHWPLFSQYERAVAAALGARFEFGETPR